MGPPRSTACRAWGIGHCPDISARTQESSADTLVRRSGQTPDRVDKPINPLYNLRMEFGGILRQLRSQKGLGIKRLGPDLGVSYTYLSKLENNEIRPSEELVRRIAAYFHYDNNVLLLSAGKVPAEILEILREHPDDAIAILRERFGQPSDARPKP